MQKTQGLLLPDTFADQFRHQNQCIDFLLCPDTFPVSFFKADITNDFSILHDIALKMGNNGVAFEKRLFLLRQKCGIAAVINPVGILCNRQMYFIWRKVLV